MERKNHKKIVIEYDSESSECTPGTVAQYKRTHSCNNGYTSAGECTGREKIHQRKFVSCVKEDADKKTARVAKVSTIKKTIGAPLWSEPH